MNNFNIVKIGQVCAKPEIVITKFIHENICRNKSYSKNITMLFDDEKNSECKAILIYYEIKNTVDSL